MKRDDFEASMARVVAEAEALIASCHKRRSCPTCWAPIGRKCCGLPKGYVIGPRGDASGRPLKHPHEARWTPDVPKR